MLLRCSVEPVAGAGPTIAGIVMDVTERHEARLALDSAEARALLVARQAGIGTWEIGLDGEMIWDEQMFRLRGLAPQDRAPTPEDRLAPVHPDDRALLVDLRPVAAVLAQPAGGAESRVRLPGRDDDRWLASRSAPMVDARGQLMGRIGVNWDIDDAKNAGLARQEAERAQRESLAKSRFLARMSHELRTPLNAVLGFAQLMQASARSEGDPGRAATLGHIHTAGEHLLTLIEDALDRSRIETGAVRLELGDVPVAVAFDEALPLVASAAADQRVLLSCRPLAGAVRADPLRLRQVLLNLLTNAIKYNRPGGRVTLSAEVVAPTVDGRPLELRLQVADTGRGIGPDQLAHLFEPFNRLGIERGDIPGSGIGLTIVESLVEGMGGRVEVASQLGVGSTFGVVLPAAAGTTDAAGRPDAGDGDVAPNPTKPAVAASDARRVLYIEDNPVNALLVEELLKLRPHVALTVAATGTEGVAAAGLPGVELVLVDMQLPDFDGFEVLRRLRADPRTAVLRCIALSANAMPDDVRRARLAGFDDYWTKPIQFKPFLAALDRLLPPP